MGGRQRTTLLELASKSEQKAGEESSKSSKKKEKGK